MKAFLFSPEAPSGLWPLSSAGTAAGVSVLGESLLVHSARALKRAGVRELVLLLPEGAAPPFQDELPMTVRRFPPGTDPARALLSCAPLADGSDFLAVDGSALWRADLAAAVALHRARKLAVTRLIPIPARSSGAGSGRVLPFPGAEGCLAVLSPAFFSLAAAGEKLPPDLLGRVETEGCFWRIDSPAALLRAGAALLSGRYGPARQEAPVRPGIWSASPLPEHVELVPPCFIGAGVVLGRGCLIGPHTVLEDGASVGEHSLVQRSVVRSGAVLGSRASVYGAVVGEQAALGNYAVLNEGAAVGAGARLGDNVSLMEEVCVGPGLEVPSSTRLTVSLSASSGAPASPGEPALTVEDLLRLGRSLGRCGLVGAGGAGFRGQLLARSFACGAAAQGAAVVFHDGLLPDQAAWLACRYQWPASLFAGEEGQIYLFDAQGRTLTAPPPEGEAGPGSWDLLAGTAAAYEAARLRGGEGEEFPPASTAFRHGNGAEFL